MWQKNSRTGDTHGDLINSVYKAATIILTTLIVWFITYMLISFNFPLEYYFPWKSFIIWVTGFCFLLFIIRRWKILMMGIALGVSIAGLREATQWDDTLLTGRVYSSLEFGMPAAIIAERLRRPADKTITFSILPQKTIWIYLDDEFNPNNIRNEKWQFQNLKDYPEIYCSLQLLFDRNDKLEAWVWNEYGTLHYPPSTVKNGYFLTEYLGTISNKDTGVTK